MRKHFHYVLCLSEVKGMNIIMEISHKLAAQIVTAICDVVKKDINLIDISGVIIGSTDARRIGQFHAAGAAAVRGNSPVIVDELHPFEGARPGINYPIFLEDNAIAAIGITGDSTELSPYGFLITKITEVFLKEQKINEELSSKHRALHYLITSLIYNDVKNRSQINALLAEYRINTAEEFSVLSVKLEDVSLEPSLRLFFQNLHIDLSTYLYPNEWVTIFTRSDFARFPMDSFIRTYKGRLFAGQGDFLPLHQLSRSYSNAVTARRHAYRFSVTYCNIDNISIEIILESLPENIQSLYAEKFFRGLSEKELYILKTYLEQDMSLKNTAEILNIHKNTLQYQLDLIEHKSGLNPRNFHNAFLFQLALFCRRK